jgi:hypothetical protein
MGWRLLSDDVAPTLMNSDVVIPFQMTPRRRVSPGREVAGSEVRALGREVVALQAERLGHVPTQIAAIVYLDFEHGSGATISELTPGLAAIEMIRNAVNFFDHKQDAVARSAEIARRIPSYGLTYGSASDAAFQLNRYEFPHTLSCT